MRNAVVATLFLAVLSAVAAASPEGAPGGNLATADGEFLPLLSTQVDAEIVADTARVTVRQVYENAFRTPIEIVYTFPLPDRAAVDDMTFTIGARTIRSEVRTREDAEERYEEASAAGQTAALTTQTRPNLFTQRIANVLPNERVVVELTYVEDLRREKGENRFVFPVVAAPRYRAGAGVPGGGPDEYLGPGEESRHRLDVAVRIDAAFPIRDLRSPSHRIDVYADGGPRAEVRIHPLDTLPVKDLVLSWRTETAAPDVSVAAHRVAGDGTFGLTLQPEEKAEDGVAVPREVILVLDCSGSMSGMPVETAKRVAVATLRTLGPDDLFQVLRFSDSASALSPQSLPAARGNLLEGVRYVDGLKGDGGTEVLSGLEMALSAPADPYRARMVLFLTDGLVGNEAEILTRLKALLGTARVFCLGVGSSVNRFLLDRMAEVGRGAADYVLSDAPDPEVDEVVDTFLGRIRSPVLHDVTIDWGGLPVRDLEPVRLPDLFAGQPVRVLGRYLAGASGTVTVRGVRGGEYWERSFPVVLPDFERENSVLPKLWARERIRSLVLAEYSGEATDTSGEVTRLALEYRLLTRHTAFVAVDERVVTDGTKALKVRQRAAWPEGVGGAEHLGLLVAAPRQRTGTAPPPAAPPPAYEPTDTRPTFGEIDSVPDLHLAFLTSWQRADGSWGDGGDVLSDTGATSLALLAYLASDRYVPGGSYEKAIRGGLAWLADRQDREGVFASDGPAPLLDHALATIAWIDAGNASGWRSGWSRAKRAVAHLLASRTRDLGWALDGGREGSDTVTTTFALIALAHAKATGMSVGDAALLGAFSQLEAATDRDTGRVMAGAGGGSGTDGRAIAAAILARVVLGTDPKATDYVRKGAGLLLRLPVPVGDRADPIYLFLATCAVDMVGGEPRRDWRPPLTESCRKEMIPAEETDAEGRPLLVGPPGARVGRAAAMALFGMARTVYQVGGKPFPFR